VGCGKIFFTSSIAVYGPCLVPTDESKLPNPITPYGGSKYPAELIHQIWLNKNLSARKLIIARPGVIFGPGDPGNILRMIKAIKKGYFVFPGSPKICKSYAYIFGFIDSIKFTMNRPEILMTYNYVETPTQSIEDIAKIIKLILKSKAPIISIPSKVLMPIAKLIQFFKRTNNPIHPIRVKKASTPTHILPQQLVNWNFEFKYDFQKAVDHWMQSSPEDFD
jgi:nucleoside-diphosphate-sugar epimerase